MRILVILFCICWLILYNVSFSLGQEKRIKIPVMFHVLYSNTTENFSTDSILLS